jgi:hypothetical protein
VRRPQNLARRPGAAGCSVGHSFPKLIHPVRKDRLSGIQLKAMLAAET